MGHFSQVIKSLLQQVKTISFQDITCRLNANYDEKSNSLVFKLLAKDYLLTHEGIYYKGQPAEELVSLIVLNAVLSPGDIGIDSEWKPYRQFPGTGGHLDLFANKVEGFLSHNWQAVIDNKEKIAGQLGGLVYQGETAADLALEFQPFANIKVLCLIYKPNEEFESTAQVLFSANADKFMPPLCLEQLALMLVKEVVKVANGQ